MTEQIHELLIIDGKKESMAFCPHFPEDDPRISAVDLYQKSADGCSVFGLIGSSACWRDYQGTWEIRDGFFYLNSIAGRWKITDDKPLLASWFSGVLKVPRGKLLDYAHMGFDSLYEQELHIHIKEGQVIHCQTIENT